VSSLVDLLNDSTPLSAPLGELIVISAIFVAAWLVGRAAGRIASFFVLRAERRHLPSSEDTGVIASLKQRETALSLARTSVRMITLVVATLLALSVLVGADRIETFVGASFLVILVAFAAQRFLADVIAGLLMFHERWFRIGDTIEIAAVPASREWLAVDLLPELMREWADEGLIVHGPVVMWVDEQAERRFARAVRMPVPERRSHAA
jgi:hypothetical protein